MKRYGKYLVLVVLLVVELVTIKVFSNFELVTLIAIWGAFYAYIAYRGIFRLDEQVNLSESAVYGGSEILSDHDHINNKSMYNNQFQFSSKWLYLTCFLIHVGICLYLIFLTK
ncbi:hypothetical protein EZV73_06750 [Acidaminobacter sp. JC074]|uniref:hypothetical protein n=1 Tax=Acidaminobacter sp. JC074 TaxID=2530199 RepID=UPI001F0FE54C|nr:hypothetical protein [Acidaminobacter sp. JC074]MCH4887262.1 hypothetical protein [Acidaminobacter sp. JC074]